MQRRTVVAVTAGLFSLGGCLDVGPLDGEGGDADDAPAGDGQKSGTMTVTVDDDPVDLRADRFQAEYADGDVRFHFHEGDAKWYNEGADVTFAQAVDLLPRFAYDRRDGAHVLTVDCTTYDARDSGVAVAFRADGDVVDPTAYVVRDGDHLVLEVATGA